MLLMAITIASIYIPGLLRHNVLSFFLNKVLQLYDENTVSIHFLKNEETH